MAKRKAKTAPPVRDERDKLMERTRATVAMTSGGSESLQLAGFMALFHPNYDPDKTRALVNDARERDRRRR